MFAIPKLPDDTRFLKPNQPKKTPRSAALLKSGRNYSDFTSPVSAELKALFWSIIKEDQSLSERLSQAKVTEKIISSHRSRTNNGYCSVSPQIKSMTCQCCKFVHPEAVLETRVFGILSNYYHPVHYDGIAVHRLVPERELGDINCPPDIMLYQEFYNETYLWRDLVDRYFSRFHWMAVKYESKRLLAVWLDFMALVNQPNTVLLFANETLTNNVLDQLSPYIPPRPEKGDFLLSVDHSEELRIGILQRVELFAKAACYVDYNPNTLTRFKLCDIVDRFTIYGADDGTPASVDYDPLLQNLLITPERNRRNVNSIRAVASVEHAEFFSPTPNNVLESLADVNGSSIHAWRCSVEERELCNYALGVGSGSVWISYVPGETQVGSVKHYWCSNEDEMCQLVESLFIVHPCYGNCEVEVKAFPSLDEFNSISYFECDFAIGIVTGPYASTVQTVESFIHKNCIASNIKLTYQFDTTPNPDPSVLVYKFDYVQQIQF
jgi:hypothetical protein